MKSLYATYASQSAVTLCRCLVLLVLIGLGACQRSTYLFQRVAEPEQPSIVLAPSTASALIVTPTKQSVSVVDSTAQPRHQSRCRVRLLPPTVRRISTLLVPRAAALAMRAKVVARSQQDPLPPDIPAHGRSRGVAFLLALLVGGLGLHLFYLGYHGRGMAYLLATLVAVVLFSIGAVGLIASLFGGGGSGFIALLVISGLLASLVGILALIDAVLIVTGNLKPRNGEYYPRFFKTQPRASTSTR
jgi:TM2 domain-containing membrane protein YozV